MNALQLIRNWLPEDKYVYRQASCKNINFIYGNQAERGAERFLIQETNPMKICVEEPYMGGRMHLRFLRDGFPIARS
jgi:hypothetical protein